jgi:hypothetical protein
MSVSGSLFRFAEQGVSDVISQFNQQQKVVQDEALTPINAIAKLIEDGGIWRGDGAKKCADELASLLSPSVGEFIDQIAGYVTNLQKASDLIKQADQSAEGAVAALEDVFSSIF